MCRSDSHFECVPFTHRHTHTHRYFREGENFELVVADLKRSMKLIHDLASYDIASCPADLADVCKTNREALVELIIKVQHRVVYRWPYAFILTFKDTIEKMEAKVARQEQSIDSSDDLNVLLKSAMETQRIVSNQFELWNTFVRQLGHGQFGLCVAISEASEYSSNKTLRITGTPKSHTKH